MIVSFEGKHPQIGRNVLVLPGSWVIGDVTLADGVSIWCNCTLRADGEPIRVGRDTNIQDGSILHIDPGVPCTVGERVIIGHGAIVHGAQVGDDVLIGMGAIVLSRAVVGSGAIVAAGALVPEGMEIPPGTLVAGVPARVLRPVKPEEKERIRQGIQEYIRRRDLYLRQPWLKAASSAPSS